jgi:hypothetical protein
MNKLQQGRKNTTRAGQLKIKIKNENMRGQCFQRCESNGLRNGCHKIEITSKDDF